MNPLRRLLALLRSPRVAALLIAACVAWLGAAALLPAVGSRPFSTWAFLATVAWLCASTAVCAWDRTVVALGTRTDGGGLWWRLGMAGSPLMHWGLVVVVGCALWGQAVRHEGVMLLFPGEPVTDSAEAYTGTKSAGPLFAERYTRTTFELLDTRRSLVVDGIERGDAPRVRARAGESTPVEAWVYPNNPLRVGGLTVNNVDSGPGVVLSVERQNTAPSDVATTRMPLSRSEGGYRASAELESPEGGTVAVTVTQLPGTRIAVATGDGTAVELSVGETADLRGARVRFREPTTWATVAVVNDPSVPWLYMGMWMSVCGAVLALFRPVRGAAVEDSAIR